RAVERRRHDARVQAQLGPHAVLVHAMLGVRLQLAPGGVHARPVRALLERELVAERRDVDGDARVRVPVPRTTDAVALVDHEVVGDAGGAEPDRGPDPREPRPDDGDLVIGGYTHVT